MGLFSKKKNAPIAVSALSTDNPELESFYESAATCLRYYQDGSFAFCRTSIGNIAAINETFGHGYGDRILDEAEKALALSDEHSIVARDRSRFITMFRYDGDDDLERKLNELHHRFENIGSILPSKYLVYMHTGYFATDGKMLDMTVPEMVECATIAESEASNHSHSSIVRYTEQLRANAIVDATMLADFDEGIKKKQFVVYLQPRFDTHTREIMGAKLMVSWHHPRLGVIGAYRFVSLFSKSGDILKLDMYLFDAAFAMLRKWLDKGTRVVPLSINVPYSLASEQNNIDALIALKRKYKMPEGLCELEFSERVVDDMPNEMSRIFDTFRSNGFLCSIEEFGAGLGKLSNITDYNIDSIKLARKFFDNGTPSEDEVKQLRDIVSAAKEAKVQTIATGVPSKCEELISDIGFDVIQGDITTDPLSPADFAASYLI